MSIENVNPDNVNPHWKHPERYGLVPVKTASNNPHVKVCVACGHTTDTNTSINGNPKVNLD